MYFPKIFAEGYRNEYGEFVAGEITPIEAWSRRRDVSHELKVLREGTRDQASRDWRVRWDS